MKSRDQKNEKATEARKQITNGVPTSLARMRVSSFFSEEGRNVYFFFKERLFSNPFPQFNVEDTKDIFPKWENCGCFQN